MRMDLMFTSQPAPGDTRPAGPELTRPNAFGPRKSVTRRARRPPYPVPRSADILALRRSPGRELPVQPDAGGRPELLPQLRLDELLAELQGRLQAVLDTRDRMRGLLEAVVAISSGLDLESTLRRIVETAIELVDATYGALGVIGSGGRLAEFIPVGLTGEEIGRIDHWPEGRGLLGLLIKDPRPLRL